MCVIAGWRALLTDAVAFPARRAQALPDTGPSRAPAIRSASWAAEQWDCAGGAGVGFQTQSLGRPADASLSPPRV